MKVLHFITRLIVGGAQQNTLLNVEDQHRDYGDQVTLVTGPGIGPEGSLEPRARAGGFDFRVIEQLGRSIRPTADWSAYRELLKLLRDIQPEIVHTHSSKAGILGRAAARRLGIPVVHTIHGASFHVGQSPLAYQLYRQAERWAGKRTDHFISVADAMTDQYVAAGVAPREKFTTIYSGMEVEPFLNPPRPRDEVRAELGLQPEHVVAGKVSRLFHLKGHHFVIEAAADVVRACPQVRFLFVGDGILRKQFEADIARRVLGEYFVFAGLVPPERIPELIAAMDIVVHTSEWEGLARVLPQALISAKPAITFDIDGAREVIIPGQTGYLLTPGSVPELIEALRELVTNPELCRRLGETGRERFTDVFRHQTMTRRIREVYARVLQ